MEPVEGLPKRGSLDAGPGFPQRSNGTPPPAVFGTGSIEPPTNGFSVRRGPVVKQDEADRKEVQRGEDENKHHSAQNRKHVDDIIWGYDSWAFFSFHTTD